MGIQWGIPPIRTLPPGSLLSHGDFLSPQVSARSWVEMKWFGGRVLRNVAENMQNIYKKVPEQEGGT